MASSTRLKESNIIRYSPMERKLFELLMSRPDKSADTEWLTLQIYKSLKRTPPQSSRIVITGVLRSLIRKARRNQEPFQIIRTASAGPYSSEVRIETDG